MTPRETGPNGFKTKFIKRVEEEFPGAIVLLMDAGYIQGVPDIFVVYGRSWAALEVKAAHNSRHQPNQDWWVTRLRDYSYASFVYPENEEEVLNELQLAFRVSRSSRLPKP